MPTIWPHRPVPRVVHRGAGWLSPRGDPAVSQQLAPLGRPQRRLRLGRADHRTQRRERRRQAARSLLSGPLLQQGTGLLTMSPSRDLWPQALGCGSTVWGNRACCLLCALPGVPASRASKPPSAPSMTNVAGHWPCAAWRPDGRPVCRARKGRAGRSTGVGWTDAPQLPRCWRAGLVALACVQ